MQEKIYLNSNKYLRNFGLTFATYKDAAPPHRRTNGSLVDCFTFTQMNPFIYTVHETFFLCVSLRNTKNKSRVDFSAFTSS